MDPRERSVDRLRQRPDEQRLAEPRHPFEQHVAASEQRGDHRSQHVLLPDQPAPHFREEPMEISLERRHRGGGVPQVTR